MLTTVAQRAPRSSLVVPIVLGIILVPLTQIGVAFLGAPGGTFLGWVVGTPVCYFLIGGLGAFTTVSGLVPVRARSRGAWVGFVAGISGACSAGLIVAAVAVWALAASPQSASLLHPQVGGAPHVFYTVSSGSSLRFSLVEIIVILLPFFLGVNLLGVGMAPLGGMLGGYLKARISPRSATLPEQTDERAVAQPRRGILVITIIAILLAILITTAGLLYFTGDFVTSGG
ncbi:MAG TPA: hypothetical protein VGF38_20545 [Ktedonobacterales bacterium]